MDRQVQWQEQQESFRRGASEEYWSKTGEVKCTIPSYSFTQAIKNSKSLILLLEKWRPLGVSNPCCRDENPVS